MQYEHSNYCKVTILRYSSYYYVYELDEIARQHYQEKLDKLGAVEDPYVVYD